MNDGCLIDAMKVYKGRVSERAEWAEASQHRDLLPTTTPSLSFSCHRFVRRRSLTDGNELTF
jgi:hypothetical protein